jgi:hypothetical protein
MTGTHLSMIASGLSIEQVLDPLHRVAASHQNLRLTVIVLRRSMCSTVA